MKTAADVLTEARELLAKPGVWAQGIEAIAEAYKGRACASAALGRGLKVSEVGGLAHIKAHLLLRRVTSDRIPLWNDTPGRTLAEVLSAFDRAIELAKANP